MRTPRGHPEGTGGNPAGVAIGGTDQNGLWEVIRERVVAVDAQGRAQELHSFDQWRLRTTVVEECDPGTIQVSVSYKYALSNEGITPGETRTQDVGLWMRQELNDAGVHS